MKIHYLIIGLFTCGLLLSVSCSQGGGQGKSIKLKSDLDTASYAFGISVGRSLKNANGVNEINTAAFAKGLSDVYNGDDTMFSEQELQIYLNQYLTGLREVAGDENASTGEKFLTENAKRDEVQVTSSGLQYEVLNEGDGKSPTIDSKVRCHYKGTLLNGDVFDSSYDRGQPAEFALNRVIPGWTEGLQLMKEGAHYKFYIPSDLAYGTRGSRTKIGPNETLIFEVELLEVLPSGEEK
jgi:FKBP-type peptidyl-prolyl cis-trans isomerase